MFEDLIKQVLPAITDQLRHQLLKQLEGVGKQIVVNQLAKSTAHALLKSIDTVIAIAVANLPSADANRLSAAYADEVLRQVQQLGDAVGVYVPLQVSVEVAKQRHGPSSPQASAARKKRGAGIAEMRQEVRDLLRAATGQDPAD